MIAVALLYYLDGRRFYLERQPRVQLADGTHRSQRLGGFHLLQSEVTTILSVFLMVLRWVATAWAVPLCWRAIFVLAGNSGLQYRDITWMINHGIFYPSTHFHRPLHLLLGLILISALAPLPSAPLLTGSISWLPSNQTIALPDHPTFQIAGFPSNDYVRPVGYYSEGLANVATYVVKNFNTAWSRATDEFIFKRVVSAAAHLSTESTIDTVLLPYFVVTRIEWLPKLDAQSYMLLRMMWSADNRVPDRMNSPGGATIIFNATDPPSIQKPLPQSWPVLINVDRSNNSTVPYAGDDSCNSSSTFLPDNTTIPYFYLNGPMIARQLIFGCFAYANVSFKAAHGLCRNCRVGSYSTVQNDTELQEMPDNNMAGIALTDMPQFLSLMAPLQDSLPDRTVNLEVYITALLTRLYSALWNAGVDATAVEFRATTGYKPSVSMPIVDINQYRVYAWLGLQLLFTLSGIGFIMLQSRSRYPLIEDTDMVAFDIDSTEVPKPSPANKCEIQELLKIEPKEDGWKFVVLKQ
ncbi:hypothetical protein RSOLAG22IIIB_13596 [Rhizoctonia solani]|uniref:Uncharacterized protein n=1 Tax=Rhizoctonia solani TaxID=456999 RepID=A0A0K6FPR4_9AGAM|nr:hypothetical protein RSOLAG22IIIB_13596 [Rhizoctonia solani]